MFGGCVILAFMNASLFGISFEPLKWDFLAMTLAFFTLTLCSLALTLRRTRRKLRIKKFSKVGVSRRVIQVRRTQSEGEIKLKPKILK